MTIGEKIKELRRKNDLTQEKLADYLNVSAQAVSKWECGIASPDLALIAPLTKLLHVSADELLGLTVEEVDARKKELEDAFDETWKTGDLKDRYDICIAAVAEYPGDMKWLNELAWVEAMRSFEYKDDETYAAEQEKAIKKFAQVIEDCEDEKVKKSAIEGIVQYLGFRGRYDEAQKYAELYPKNDAGYSRVKIQSIEPDGRIKPRQEWLKGSFWDVAYSLIQYSIPFPIGAEVVEAMLNTAFPDGNFLDFHALMLDIYASYADRAVKAGDCDRAAEMLKKAAYHMWEYFKIDHMGNTEIYKYTSPLFDRLELDPSGFFHSGQGPYDGGLIGRLKTAPMYEPIRQRADFEEILALFPDEYAEKP